MWHYYWKTKYDYIVSVLAPDRATTVRGLGSLPHRYSLRHLEDDADQMHYWLQPAETAEAPY